ncbi:MAG: hypothetical protein ACYDAZ_01870 [Thermoplasmataceae archaeon]
MIILPERRHPDRIEDPMPIDEPYLPGDPGDEPKDAASFSACVCHTERR